jgi:hypothetical protein
MMAYTFGRDSSDPVCRLAGSSCARRAGSHGNGPAPVAAGQLAASAMREYINTCWRAKSKHGV